MIKYFKDATNAVAKKQENMLEIEKLNKQIYIAENKYLEIEKKKNELYYEIEKKEKEIKALNQEAGRLTIFKLKTENENNELAQENTKLKEQNTNLTKQLSELNKENELKTKLIIKKEIHLNNLDLQIQYMESQEDPAIKKRKSVARLCSALKQYNEMNEKFSIDSSKIQFSYPYIVDFDKSNKNILSKQTLTLQKNERAQRELEWKLHNDKQLNELMERFVDRYNCFTLIIPQVVEYIDKHIISEMDDVLDFNTPRVNVQNNAWDLYKDHISVFFEYLEQRNFLVKNNEVYYLQLLKEKAMNKNYEELEDEFYELLQLRFDELTMEQVIQHFIKTIDKEINTYKYLAFLDSYLVKHGFIANSFSDLDELYELVLEESKQYELLKFEKSLLDTKEQTNENKITIKDVELMTGREFEEFLVILLNNLGYRAEITKTTGDQGVDIIAKKNGKKYAIQAKRYSVPVGNKAVQEVVAGKAYYRTDKALVITNNKFTPSAIDAANKTKTLLWDGQKLMSMIELANM